MNPFKFQITLIILLELTKKNEQNNIILPIYFQVVTIS